MDFKLSREENRLREYKRNVQHEEGQESTELPVQICRML